MSGNFNTPFHEVEDIISLIIIKVLSYLILLSQYAETVLYSSNHTVYYRELQYQKEAAEVKILQRKKGLSHIW